MRVDLGGLEQFADGVPVRATAAQRAVVVVRSGERVYALEDRCSHEDFPLSAGEVDLDAGEIECARHGALFRLEDGAPVSLPATRPVATFPAQVADGRVVVELP